MDLLQLPFNHLIGVKAADKAPYLLMLPSLNHYQNHLQSVHAGALFTLAEGTAAQFLLNTFTDIQNIIPVVRKAEVKFSKQAIGAIYGKAQLHQCTEEEIRIGLNQKGRISFSVLASIHNQDHTQVFAGMFEWFVSKN
jgi:acyl-coenzyme A thioesterase PaaI-like protein